MNRNLEGDDYPLFGMKSYTGYFSMYILLNHFRSVLVCCFLLILYFELCYVGSILFDFVYKHSYTIQCPYMDSKKRKANHLHYLSIYKLMYFETCRIVADC